MSKCDHCGTEVTWKTVLGTQCWVAANGIHTDYDCREALKGLLAERDERVRKLDQAISGVLAKFPTWALGDLRDVMGASAPAGEPRWEHGPGGTHCKECGVSRYGNHVQQPGEHYPRCSQYKPSAPQESGVPSGRCKHDGAVLDSMPPICGLCGAIDPWDSPGTPDDGERRGNVHKTSASYGGVEKVPALPSVGTHAPGREAEEPGTLLGEYERMAREWFEGQVELCIVPDRDLARLAALLARVADEQSRTIVERGRREFLDGDAIEPSAIFDWIASNAWRAEGKK